MTVCSLLFGNQIPIVLTDSLISCDDDKFDGFNVDTPINFSENRPGLSVNKIHYPIGIANKIWKITCNDKSIYMLYAGSVSSAKAFAQTISTFHYDNLIRLINDNYLKEKLIENNFLPIDLSVILIYLDGDSHISYWFHNAAHLKESSDFVISIGSGSELFLEEFVSLLKFSLEKKNSLLYAFSKLNDENTSNETLRKYLEGKILFSLNLLANLTKESIKKDSKILSKSCGGLFNIFFLPELYNIKDNCVLTSPICQIFLELRINKLHLAKLIITSRNEYFESIVSCDELALSNFDNIKISKKDLKKYNIKDTFRLSSVNNDIKAINNMKINHLIVYIYDNEKQCHTVHSTLNKDGVMNVSSSNGHINLTFSDKFIEKILDRFRRV